MRLSAPSQHDFEARAMLAGLGSSAELRALVSETDPNLFFESLLAYGGRREAAGDLEGAARVYARIQEGSSAELSRRAALRLDAILGRGAAGPRAEFLLRRLAAEASDPAALFAMGAAVAVYRTARLAALARLTASPTANFFTRGFGARAAASLAGFALEAPVFTGAGRLANQTLGRAQDWAPAAVARDLASSYLVLGALKAAGWGSGAALGTAGMGLRSRPTATGWGAGVLLPPLFRQGGLLAGILLGHRLEAWAGLRHSLDGATTLVDSLATLFQLHVAGRLSEGVFGAGLHRGEIALEARHRGFERGTLRDFFPAPLASVAPSFAVAAVGPQFGVRPEPLRLETGGFPPSSAPAYETFHYPPGGKGARPPRARYGVEARRLWVEMEPELRSVDFTASREEILARRPDLERADRYWELQVRDFARLLGGGVEVHPPERLLEPFSGQFLRPDGELVRSAAGHAAGRGRVFELSLPYANAAFGRASVQGQYSNLRHLMGELEDAFGRHLQLQFAQNGRLRVRIPNFALWEGLLVARFGEAAHRPIPVDGIIARDDTMRLRGNLLAPLGMVRQAEFISELQGRVHPFFVPFHDLYHATMASMLPPDLCRSCGALYFPLLRELPPSGIKQAHLDRLSDLDPGSDYHGNPDTFVKFALLPFWHSFFSRVESGAMTRRRLQQYPQFLQSYRRLLRDPAATPGVAEPWRASFDRRLAEFGEEFSRLLVSVLRK